VEQGKMAANNDTSSGLINPPIIYRSFAGRSFWGKPGIYRIRNIFNGRVYVGSSRNVQNRFKTHRDQLMAGTHNNRRLKNDFNDFGPAAFVFEILEWIARDNLNKIKEIEQQWLDASGCLVVATGYNICPTSNGSIKAPETRTLISLSKIGHTPSAETRAKMRESRGAMLPSITRRPNYPNGSASSKAILQLGEEGKLIQEFCSAAAAERATGISFGSISSCLRGASKTAGGFIWKFKRGPMTINQLDIFSREKIASFQSISAASSATNVSKNRIRMVIDGRGYSAGGFFWTESLTRASVSK
jgi:group I intron endonuclease